MATSAVFQSLEPQSVWSHFATLCAIPRPSLHEAALKQRLIAWAQARGITAIVDAAGNLILKKSASPGCEGQPGVILQGHLDMVCQANAGTVHDFERDPINAVVRDGWVVAENTTLGADNGIGVALALAALEEPNLIHPPLEVLLTVNEESGMDGARGLAAGTLHGKTLINLDTEEWGHFYLGCAGGVDVEVRHTMETLNQSVRGEPAEGSPHGGGVHTGVLLAGAVEPWTDADIHPSTSSGRTEDVPPGYVLMRLEVAGLRGGHSGIDIHLGRGNAIKLLAEALSELAERYDLHLVKMAGGTARNAIPREAFALFALPAAGAAQLADWAQQKHAAWRERFAQADAGVALSIKPVRPELVEGQSVMSVHGSTAPARSTPVCAPPPCGDPSAGSPRTGLFSAIARAEQQRLLAFLNSAANGVARTSDEFPGVTDTSDNLGVLALTGNEFKATFKVRSLHDARADALADALVAHAASSGLRAWKEGVYPGWTPNPASSLLALCQQVYTAQFGQPASLQVIHAGLECGLLAASHPHLDMISFGPDIRGAHAPGESVEIESVARCWQLLKAVLQALAK